MRQGLSRRAALQALAAGVASLAPGCSRPDESIVAKETLEELPYVHLPEGLVPGLTQHYATALPLAGYGRGALVASFEGRPIKAEGNPRHPASLGATDVFAQAEILSLYDPDRSQAIRVAGEISDWPAFVSALQPRLEQLRSGRGASLRLLSGRVTSPTLLEQRQKLDAALPNMRWHVFEPSETETPQAAQAVYGKPMILEPRFADADVVVAFGADPIGPGPDQVRYSRALVERRKLDRASCRLYAAESVLSLTGAFADHRFPAPPDAIEAMIAALASNLGAPIERPKLPPDGARFVEAFAKDLQAHRGRGLVLVGPSLPNAAALGAWINDRLDAPINAFDPDPLTAAAGTLSELVEDIGDGKVETLVILDSNPVATAPGDLNFAAMLARPSLRIHLGAYFDETAAASTWHLPAPQPLESWSDLAATDGVVSIVQPLIHPLHDSYSAHRLLAALAGEPDVNDYDRVRATWRARWRAEDFDQRWRQTLIDGVIADTGAKTAAKPPPKFPGWAPPAPASDGGLTAIFHVDPSVFDGRYANNAWLQECPQPFSKSVWGNAVEMSLADASRLGVEEGDEVEVSSGGRYIYGAMRLSNGLAAGVLSFSLGYGRTRAGAIGDGVGFNAATLQSSASPFVLRDVILRKIGPNGRLSPATAGLFALPGKAEELTPEIDVGAVASTPTPLATLFPPWPTPVGDPYAWGMVVDTDACIGCNACVVACQSENNVPAIGPDEIGKGRVMQWLRIDAYDHATAPDPRPVFQPVPCMHCELAPCEPVCPVEASVHDHEGLNGQVYNRCIGTQFCQSNCPYKVRRFNWFGYADGEEYKTLGNALVKAANNPDVSVRARGVMEKCTYCVQRISRARRLAERETRLIAEGEVVTACQQACPTRAIQFGNLVDPEFERFQASPRSQPLRAPRRSRHPPAHHLSGEGSQFESRGRRRRMTIASFFERAPAREEPPVLVRPIDDRTITNLVCAPLMRPAGKWWWIAFIVCSVGTLATLYGVYMLFNFGIGIFGNNTSVVWGFPIANYVWWIGLGNAGTLISSLLLLTRQSWRNAISRFAEAMTLFAVSIAGLFPIFHLGRPLYFYWLAPYPDTMTVWPQWRSALVWDFWAITSYLIFSIIFWYVGVIPDLATARDRSRGAWQKVYGVVALGWRGSVRHWRHYHRLQLTLAALATPLVCSVHSIVGLDFAASLMPGWREPIFPPYFVVGAMYSGFALVVILAATITHGLGLQALITMRHFEAMAKIILMASIVMGLSYLSEYFAAWYAGNPDDRGLVAFEFTGAYWQVYAGMLFCNVIAPQILWFPRMRASLAVIIGVSFAVLVGMWLERILIVWNTLSHTFVPSMDRVFFPTGWDWLFLFGPMFFFCWMFLLFCRLVPVVPMFEVRELRHQEASA